MTQLDRRVLMIAPSAVLGGAEDVLFNLAMALPAFGLTLDVVSLQTGPLVDRLTEHGIDVTVIEAGRLRDLVRFTRSARQLATMMRRTRYAAVVSNLPKAHLYAALPARTRRLPALWFQAGYPDPAHWTDRIASALPATGVIAVSSETAAAQQRLNRRRTVHLMHPGIDLSRFRVGSNPAIRARYGIPPSSTLVALVGRLQPWKGQREFLRAGALVAESHPQAHFAVVGGAILGWEGDYPAQLKKLASGLGLEGRVTFTGHTNEVTAWMNASDIVVNASQPEPFGLVIVEAMASGCAVVAVASGGPRDIIEHQRSGLLCETRDPAVLADAVRRLLDDGELRVALGRAGRARVEAQFSRESMARRFTDIIREAAEDRPIHDV